MHEISFHPSVGCIAVANPLSLRILPLNLPFSLLICLNAAFTGGQSSFPDWYCFTIFLVDTALSVAVSLHHPLYI